MKSKRRREWEKSGMKKSGTNLVLLRLDRWLGRGGAGAMTHSPSSKFQVVSWNERLDECDQKEVARPFVVLTM
jgi:hypothetical protein